MPSTVGLELTNSTFTWKKFPKGNRRTPRRPRKFVPGSLRPSDERFSKNLGKGDMPVSESEKLGVNVLGCRFSERVEHIPIKKRRFFFRTPSPPPRAPQPRPEETERLVKSEHNSAQEFHSNSIAGSHFVAIDATSANDLGQIVDTELSVDAKEWGKVDAQLDDSEDFSGISILAAAACSDSSGGDNGYAEAGSGVEESFVREGRPEVSINNESCFLLNRLSKEDLAGSAEISTEGTSSCISTVLVQELVSSLTLNNFSESLTHGHSTEATYLQDKSGAVSRDLSSEGAVKRSLRDDRLHWDLNTVMDAWERPFDHANGSSHPDAANGVSEDVVDVMCIDKMRNPEGNDMQKSLGVTEFDVDVSKELVHDTQESNIDDCAAGTQHGESIFSISQFEKNNVASPVVAFPENVNHESRYDLENGGNSEEIFSLHSGQGIPKNVANMETNQLPETDSLHHVIEDSVCKSDEAGFPQPLGASTGGQIAVAVDSNVQHVKAFVHGIAETGIRPHTDVGETAIKSAKPRGLGSKNDANDIVDLANSSGKVVLEKPFQDSYNSDVSKNNQSPIVGMKNTSELQVDYDSQYEDGELRESIEHTWEGYDGEDAEAEQVDYESDMKDTYSSDGHVTSSVKFEGEECRSERLVDANILSSEADPLLMRETNSRSCLGDPQMTNATVAGSCKKRSHQTSHLQLSRNDAIHESDTSGKVDKEPGAGFDKVLEDSEIYAWTGDANDSRESVDMKKVSGWDRLPESHESSDKGIGDGGSRKGDDYMVGMDVELHDRRVVESRTFKRDFSSRVGGPTNGDMFFRNDRLQRSRASFVDDWNPRSDREPGFITSSGRGRYSRRYNARGRGGERFFRSSGDHRGLRRSPPYHGPTNFHCPGTDNASSDGFRRPFRRSVSPVDRDRFFGTREGVRPYGEIRGRYASYGLLEDGRNFRGRYHGPISDNCIESSSNYSHRLVRERSFSPTERRGNPQAHRLQMRSPSRSRTRSPSDWHSRQSPRARSGIGAGNPCFRRQSRSPDFRSERRVTRMRSPYQRPGFAADNMGEFVSMPRRQGSPQHNSRWIGDRNDGAIHFREHGYRQRSSVPDRRSPPGRIFSRGDRYDFVDFSRNLKPNEYNRPMQPQRFSRMDGGAGRGPRHEGCDDDRRKYGYRYEPVHPFKRYDNADGGGVKRFHNDIEDGFAVEHTSRNKDTTDFDGRGSPKGYNKDTGSYTGDVSRSAFIYGQDGKFSSNSESFRIRECDDEDPKRSREEKGTSVYRQDRKFIGNPESFGIRECDDEDPKRSREEKGTFIYRQDGNFSGNPGSFGTRECDNEDPIRRYREEQGTSVYRQDEKFSGNSESSVTQECDDEDPKSKRP